jgi:hypothetical protein
MPELISLRAYARHRGVTQQAVQKAVKAGRIRLTDGKIDPTTADADWANNTDPRTQQKADSVPAKTAVRESVQPVDEPVRETVAELQPETHSTSDVTGALAYSKARAIREGYLARIAKIEFEERSDKLISRNDVEVAAFNRFRTFRDGMLNIPDRLAAQLAAETDAGRAHHILSTEIRRALTEFADASS